MEMAGERPGHFRLDRKFLPIGDFDMPILPASILSGPGSLSA